MIKTIRVICFPLIAYCFSSMPLHAETIGGKSLPVICMYNDTKKTIEFYYTDGYLDLIDFSRSGIPSTVFTNTAKLNPGQHRIIKVNISKDARLITPFRIKNASPSIMAKFNYDVESKIHEIHALKSTFIKPRKKIKCKLKYRYSISISEGRVRIQKGYTDRQQLSPYPIELR